MRVFRLASLVIGLVVVDRAEPQSGYHGRQGQGGYMTPSFGNTQSYGSSVSSFARQSASFAPSFDKPIQAPVIASFSIGPEGPRMEPQSQTKNEYGPPKSQQLQAQSCPRSDPETNKAFVLKVYQEVFGDHNLSNLEKYFATDYIQHNPMAADGIEALRGLINAVPEPPQKIQFMRSAASQDLVWTHSKIKFFGKDYAAVDIFRIECGLIKEHWDVLQDTALTMPAKNDHPFF